MSRNNVKGGTQKGLKDSECKRGNVINRPPLPYIPPADHHEKRDSKQIKVKLPDRTTSQCLPSTPEITKTT